MAEAPALTGGAGSTGWQPRSTVPSHACEGGGFMIQSSFSFQCYDRDMQILVVEDEQRMADLLERTLGEEGHQVVVARDGREGFEIARDSPFDVIVLDWMLPGMDGLDRK